MANTNQRTCAEGQVINFIRIPLQRDNWHSYAIMGIFDFKHQDLPDAEVFLNPEELAFVETLKGDIRIKSYLAGRWVAKNTLAHFYKIDELNQFSITSGVFQQPIIQRNGYASSMKISLSHHRHQSICLLYPEGHPMGIDLELASPVTFKDICSQMTSSELELDQQKWLTLPHFYTYLWTIKEALSKVLTTGLSVPMEIYEIEEMQKKGHFFVSSFKNFTQYQAISYHQGSNVYSFVLPLKTNCDLEALNAYIENKNR